ncbi:MAG TPA: PQQ-binding-like beta-propeller repeat protein [Baekduia sp.]|nr:PQQ-binding-like beta-propeller repeat protein [Baekduia sp.]
MRPFPHIGRRWLAAGVVAILVGAAAVAGLVVSSSRPGNISNPDVEYVATQPPPVEKPKPAKQFSWPLYGYTPARTRYLPLETNGLRPPFGRVWRLGGATLLEFPPVICGQGMFIVKNTGSVYAIRRSDGYLRWTKRLGRLAASSPACGNGTVYATILQTSRGSKRGRVAALKAKTGATRWSRVLPSRSESSPLLFRGRLYFGSEDGRVYALDAKTGSVKWIYRAGGAVKGALAMDGGKLYFGDYAGQVTALDRATGRRVWRSSTGGSGPLGAGEGNLYSTAAVAYGRVFIGSTNGFVYSFSSRTGRLAWRHKTGGYVYSSPAVGPAGGGTVYIGSYDGTFFALDARSGKVRWTRKSGGRISGAAAIFGDIVAYANLGRRSVALVSASTGRLIWSRNNGGFDPGISDGKHLYLQGYSMIQAWQERKR